MALIVLEYLKIVLSAPVMAATASLIICQMFKAELRDLLRRIAHIKLPGGGELTATQQAHNRSEGLRPMEAPQLPPGDDQVKLPAELNGAPDEKVQHLIRSERATALLWEYRYLNYYLARTTQIVLDDLAHRAPVSLRQFDSELMVAIRDPMERQAILQALRTHHLVSVQGDLIEVTPKGREYLQWRGPLPPIPKAEPPAEARATALTP